MENKKNRKTANAGSPFVAIILVNYNGWQDTVECLESIFRNGHSSCQVIVCDNASADGSLEKIRSWADGKKTAMPAPEKHMRCFSAPPVHKPVPYLLYEQKNGKVPVFKKNARLVLVKTGGNPGFAGGNNAGIRGAISYSDYIWLLNNDTVMEKNSLTEMLRLAEGNKKIGIVGSKLLYYRDTGTIQNFGNRRIGWKGIGESFLPNMKDRPLADTEVNSVIGASLLIRKETVRAIGLMDEKYFMQDEETDWCVRASAAGYLVYSCAASRIYHKEGKSSNRSRQNRKILFRTSRRIGVESFLIPGYYSVRNEIYFVRKNYSEKFILYFLLVLPCKICRLVLGILFFRDPRPFLRIKWVLRGFMDGMAGRMGMTVDPGEWKAMIKGKGGKN